jgi:NAD(P)-dependent dehydrogenase (short-subunit alcohol dehydrogenase family)
VQTRFSEALYRDRAAAVISSYPLGRLGVPADIAEAVVFLLSDRAAWITGQVLTIDGGLSLTGGIE